MKIIINVYTYFDFFVIYILAEFLKKNVGFFLTVL